MSIAVIDQGAELFWFVSNALLQDELPLKHLKTVQAGESYILQELPAIVVLSGDDNSIDAIKFIGKIRNHVFARHTLFIVIASDTSPEYKRDLLIAGAGQVLYRSRGQNPSPKFFRNLIKWFLNLKNPDPQTFEFKPVSFDFEGDFSTFGRIGWISNSQCHIEVNLDLNPGQSIELRNHLFDELEIKDVKLTVIDKNKSGRYYQYSNGFLCKIETKKPDLDKRKLTAWIESNQDISKFKPIKVLYYEQNVEDREQIKSIIKIDKRYCARGFPNLDNFLEELEYQLPHLVLIDRQLIEANKTKFDPIKKFLKTHFCYCVTYDNEGKTSIEEFKKNYDFAMHVPLGIESQLLESMIEKLETKLFSNQSDDSKNKVYFNKYSPYSRMSLHSRCKINEIAITGIGLEIPFLMSSYCAFQVSALGFTYAGLNRLQYFRCFSIKKTPKANYHQCIIMGQTIKDNELINHTVEKIRSVGFEKWKEEA